MLYFKRRLGDIKPYTIGRCRDLKPATMPTLILKSAHFFMHNQTPTFKQNVLFAICNGAQVYKDIFIDFEYQVFSKAFTRNSFYIISATKSNFLYAKPFVQTLFSKNNELSSHRFCLQSVCYQTCFVNFIRCFVAQPLMNPFTIEELYKFPETFSQFLCA